MLDGWTTPASGGVLWWGAFQVSPSPSRLWADPERWQHQTLHTCSSSDNTIKKPPFLCSTHSVGLMAAYGKSLWWIHVTSQGVHTPEGDSPRCVHMGRWNVSKHSLYLLTASLEPPVGPLGWNAWYEWYWSRGRTEMNLFQKLEIQMMKENILNKIFFKAHLNCLCFWPKIFCCFLLWKIL